MRIKLDENLPVSLKSAIEKFGHDVDTTQHEGLRGRTDREVWDAAQKDRRFLITQDLDFSDIRRFAPGSHHGLLLIRLRSPDLRILIDRVTELFRSDDSASWTGCVVIATDRKVRVLRPSPK
ncbi:MAG: DUF5615 family PIN-like protein [Candidatus Acidiferrales bacterium]